MKFSYILAPLEDFSDNALRTLCYRHGADLTFTEMIRVEALAKKVESVWERIEFKDDTPTAIQISVNKEYVLKKFLSMFKPKDSFKGFNFNFGCPDPQIVKLGQGCAMIKRVAKAEKLIKIIKKNGYNASIKLRLGMNLFEREKKIYLNLIKNVNADFFVVHSRYGTQKYNEPADFSVYSECVDTGKVIVANGDIETKEQVKNLKTIGLNGVMLARSAIVNPAIFDYLKDKDIPDISIIRKEYEELALKYNSPFRYRNNVIKHLGKPRKASQNVETG